MKTMATVLVVVGHVTIFYSNIGGVVDMPVNTILDYIVQFIYTFHMPLFIFVSGAVYHICIRSGKYKCIGIFIIKKAYRLMLPYFLWGIFLVTPIMVLMGFTDLSWFRYVEEGIFLCQNSRHLWFLWTLFFVSVIVRVLQPLLDRWGIYRVSFLIVCLVLWRLSWSMPALFCINSIARYMLWYYLGYWFDSFRENQKIFVKKGFPVICLFVILTYLQTGNNLWVGLAAGFAGIMLIYYFSILADKYSLGQCKIYCLLERDGFGIYLIHPMIIYAVFYFFHNYMENPYFISTVIVILAIFVSIMITEILRKIKLQFLLGEL